MLEHVALATGRNVRTDEAAEVQAQCASTEPHSEGTEESCRVQGVQLGGPPGVPWLPSEPYDAVDRHQLPWMSLPIAV